MQIKQTITFSKKTNSKEGKMVRQSRSFMYMPKIKEVPNMETKWHEEVYRENRAVC